MKYLLGVDFGGGASKATLLSTDGVIVATNSVEYPSHYPQAGYVEQNPQDWYDATKENIAALLKKSAVNPTDILAVSFDAATHTAVLLDDDFNVVRPSIYWSDSRATKESAYLRENYKDLILSQALHSPDTIWTLPQLMWLRDNQPDVWQKVTRILFPKDYVRYLFTGVYCTDYIEAEGSMLFDFNTLSWSPELCSLLGFDIQKLPPVVAPTDIVGTVTAAAAADTGLAEGTKVVCGTTDTAMEVFASGAVAKGNCSVKLATAGRICVVTDKAFPDRDIINYSHVVKGLWYPGTATKACASSYRWYRDTFGGDYKDLDKAAAAVPVGSEGLIYHPYINGELTPYADPLLCGSFTGIRSGHTKGHFSRAVMEGVAMSLIDSAKVVERLGITHDDHATIIGGGAYSPIWRQIVSDALNLELRLNENSDSSFGTAMLAGVAVGAFDSFEGVIRKCAKTVAVNTPNPENTKKYAELFETYKAIHDALAPVYHERAAK